jgi:GxxExxY protein
LLYPIGNYFPCFIFQLYLFPFAQSRPSPSGSPVGSALTGLREKDGCLQKTISGGNGMSKLVHYELSCQVLNAVFSVHRAVGPGLLEAVYEGSLCVELEYIGLSFERQKVIPVIYRGEYVGAYFADLVVENTIILELKSVKALNEVMDAQRQLSQAVRFTGRLPHQLQWASGCLAPVRQPSGRLSPAGIK